MFNLFTISFLSAGIFGLSSISIHFLRKDLNPTRHTLSSYAIGNKGWLVVFGLYCMVSSKLALSIGIIKQDGMSAGALLLGFTSIGPFLAATFPAATKGKQTIGNYVHLAGALIEFLLFPISLLMLSNVFKDNNPTLANFSLLIGILTEVLFFIILLLFLLKYRKGKNIKYFGIIEKLNIFLILNWIMYTSFVLI
jgi:hypothetical protein